MSSQRPLLISPSILSADFMELPHQMEAINTCGAQWLHFDVMDRHFVEALTFGPAIIQQICDRTPLFKDAHLMIDHPERDIDAFLEAGVDHITIHVESASEKDIRETLQKIHKAGKTAGLSLKPNTSPELIKPFLEEIDLVLIMTVEPGKGGQPILPETLAKISTFRKWIDEAGLQVKIECDGGIKADNIHELYRLGMDVAVMGSAFFKVENFRSFIQAILSKVSSPA